MAILIVASKNYIEVALDGATDFDITADLVALGLAKEAPDGLHITKIIYIPSATDDAVIVRDGENGPRMFEQPAALGTYDVLKDDVLPSGPRNKVKRTKPYIHWNETTVSVVNQAYVIFELAGDLS